MKKTSFWFLSDYQMGFSQLLCQETDLQISVLLSTVSIYSQSRLRTDLFLRIIQRCRFMGCSQICQKDTGRFISNILSWSQPPTTSPLMSRSESALQLPQLSLRSWASRADQGGAAQGVWAQCEKMTWSQIVIPPPPHTRSSGWAGMLGTRKCEPITWPTAAGNTTSIPAALPALYEPSKYS